MFYAGKISKLAKGLFCLGFLGKFDKIVIWIMGAK